MTVRCHLPARASYRDLIRDLLGATVQVRNAAPQELDRERPAQLAGYRFDDGTLAAVAVLDAALSAAVASALAGAVTSDDEPVEGEGARLDGERLELVHEVVNVAGKLFNSPTTPHVKLADLVPVPGQVPQDVAALAVEPRDRQDWFVTVDGFGEGTLTLLG